jgi:VanZ family protein
VLWAAVILAVTSLPNPSLPSISHIDKLGHLGMYGVLGGLTMWAALPAADWRRRALVVLAAVSLFGAFDEWHQQFVPGRSQDRRDWLADTAGAGLGIMLAVAARHRREQRT